MSKRSTEPPMSDSPDQDGLFVVPPELRALSPEEETTDPGFTPPSDAPFTVPPELMADGDGDTLPPDPLDQATLDLAEQLDIDELVEDDGSEGGGRAPVDEGDETALDQTDEVLLDDLTSPEASIEAPGDADEPTGPSASPGVYVPPLPPARTAATSQPDAPDPLQDEDPDLLAIDAVRGARGHARPASTARPVGGLQLLKGIAAATVLLGAVAAALTAWQPPVVEREDLAAGVADIVALDELHHLDGGWVGKAAPDWPGLQDAQAASDACTALVGRVQAAWPETLTLLDPQGIPVVECLGADL